MAISRHRQADTSAFFFQRLSGGFTHSAFHIEMTDETRNARSPGFERRTFSNGRQIGKIYFDKAVASYLGDFVIHFNHPTWRDDQNQGSTATLVDGRCADHGRSRPPGCSACGSWPLGNHEKTPQNARSQERLEALVLTEFQLVALEKALGFNLATVIHLTQYCHSIYNDGKAARQGSVQPSLMDVMSAIQEWER